MIYSRVGGSSTKFVPKYFLKWYIPHRIPNNLLCWSTKAIFWAINPSCFSYFHIYYPLVPFMVNLITPILLPQGFSCHALMVVLCALLVIVQYLFPTIRAGDARWKSVKKASSPPTASCDQIVCNSSSSRLFRPVIVHCPTPSHHHLYHPRMNRQRQHSDHVHTHHTHLIILINNLPNPLWLSQALNQGQSCQCTCVSYIRSGAVS